MSATDISREKSEAAIFARVWDNGRLSTVLARHILKLDFSEADRVRMHELAVKNQEARLSPAEQQELDNFIKVADLLALIQSKARRFLERTRATSPRHG
jgi:hypothetical protein